VFEIEQYERNVLRLDEVLTQAQTFTEEHCSFNSMMIHVGQTEITYSSDCHNSGKCSIGSVSAINPTSQNFTLEPLHSYMITIHIPSDGGLHGNLSASGPVNFALMDSSQSVLFGSNYSNMTLFNYPLMNGGTREGDYEMLITNPSLSKNVSTQLNFEIKSWHIVGTWAFNLGTSWAFAAIMIAALTTVLGVTYMIVRLVKDALGSYRSRKGVPIPISKGYRGPSFPIRGLTTIQQTNRHAEGRRLWRDLRIFFILQVFSKRKRALKHD
jgi:hypothetical protein